MNCESQTAIVLRSEALPHTLDAVRRGLPGEDTNVQTYYDDLLYIGAPCRVVDC